MSIEAFAARYHRPQNARVLVGQRCRHRSHNGVAPTAVRKRPMSSAAASIGMLVFAGLLYLLAGVSPLVQWRA